MTTGTKASFGLRTTQAVFATLFMAFLLAPTAQEHLRILSYQPVVENRLREPKPSGVLGIFDSSSGYAHKYETYYNDSYGLRDLFIKLKNQLDLWLFRTSDEVLIGDDGWIFYRKLYERDMVKLERSISQVPRVVERLLALNSMLKARGVTLVVVPCPAKTTVYRELVPAAYPVPADQTAFQQYRKLLRAHPELATVDVQGILESLKPRMRVYHKTDFHWTDPAGAVVWKELHKLLAQRAGLSAPLYDRVTIAKKHGSTGGEVNSLAVFYPPTETALNLKVPLTKPDGTMEYSKTPNRWDYLAADPGWPGLLPPTVLLGDSFADAFLRAGFAGAFSRLSKFPHQDFAGALSSLPDGPSFFILEHIESALLGMTLDQWWPPQLKEIVVSVPAGPSGQTQREQSQSGPERRST